MTDHTKKPTRDELIAMLPHKDWELHTGSKAPPVKNRPLEELVRTSHARQAKGEEPGIIKKVEAMLELDLIQLQELWVHLGLPI